jgi:uncharacterized integral membrane protein
MSIRLILALALIGLLILFVIFNPGHLTVSFGFTELRAYKAIVLFGVFVTGLVTGALLKGK